MEQSGPATEGTRYGPDFTRQRHPDQGLPHPNQSLAAVLMTAQQSGGGSRLLSGAQVDRVNRRIKQATVKRVHYDDPDQPARPLAKVISAYTFG